MHERKQCELLRVSFYLDRCYPHSIFQCQRLLSTQQHFVTRWQLELLNSTADERSCTWRPIFDHGIRSSHRRRRVSGKVGTTCTSCVVRKHLFGRGDLNCRYKQLERDVDFCFVLCRTVLFKHKGHRCATLPNSLDNDNRDSKWSPWQDRQLRKGILIYYLLRIYYRIDY